MKNNLTRRSGFTVIECIVVLAVVLILAAILYPILAKDRTPYDGPSCQSNLKQISLCFAQYIQDYNEYYPRNDNSLPPPNGSGGWASYQLQPYMKSTRIFGCPKDSTVNDTGDPATSNLYSYGANINILGHSQLHIVATSLTVLNYEVAAPAGGLSESGAPTPTSDGEWIIHLDGSNFGFADGHVKWLKPGQVGKNGLSKAGDARAGRYTFSVS